MIPGLDTYRQFILWRKVGDDKLPVDPTTGAVHDAHDPVIWRSAEEAAASAATLSLNVGFVITEADPFFFLDIDDCLQDGQWSPSALWLCQQFAGCAVEVSTSGTGLHIIGTMPERLPHSIKNKELGTDLYTEKRFIALTGNSAMGSAAFCPSEAYRSLVAAHFPPAAAAAPDADWTEAPDAEWTGPEDDTELIARAMASKSAGAAFGNRASFRELWEADEDALSRCYPDDHGIKPFDHSRADSALCQHLAFWTGKNCARIDQLFRQSGLMRDKWEDRPDNYAHPTVLKAVGLCKSVCKRREPMAPRSDKSHLTAEQPDGDPAGNSFLTVQQQIEHFTGCVYVRDAHHIFTPDGGMLKPEQFRAMYGGYQFSLDLMNDKMAKSAFEAFTESRGHRFPKVYRACFRPELKSGEIIEEAKQSMVNTYVPIPVKSTPGDPSPFLNHLALVLSNADDQKILLSYMAACVQHIGVKFQWCPILQGAEGNGKTLFTRCMGEAIGWKYVHTPNAKDIGNKFNGWIEGKLFVSIEEIYVADRQDMVDNLKPMITDDRIDIHRKGYDQVTGDNRANFWMSTNHRDGVRKTKSDRRFCVFYTAQQDASDIRAAGMTGNYFPDLYRWLRSGGFAIITNYLQTYQIPDALNPATQCHRAPETSSTAEAIVVSMGGIEQDICEAVDEGLPGFANGWISSMALAKLLEKRKVTQNTRKEILKELDYIPHPGLPNGGRVNNPILPEGGKPRLYVKKHHINASIEEAALVRHKYMEDQGWPAVTTGASAPITITPR